MGQLLQDRHIWLVVAASLAGAIGAALIAHRAAFRVATWLAARTKSVFYASAVRHATGPARFALLVLSVYLALFVLPPSVARPLRHAAALGLIAAIAWLGAALTRVVEDLAAVRLRADGRDSLSARTVQTQIRLLRHVVVVVVWVVAVAAMLMTFPGVRQFGASLLASAGLAGLVVGLAARSTLSNLIAGVQVALTAPIRLEDVVIVNGEWGWIEEIGTTYVVVRIWDLRRLVVPLSYFIEHPFENWTRRATDLLGTVFIYADYTVPIDEVRRELRRILDSSGMWDGKSWGLQVTNATDRTVELRALMSAPDSATAWDLRCHVREKLIGFLQEHYPQSLPRTRALVQADAARPAPDTGGRG